MNEMQVILESMVSLVESHDSGMAQVLKDHSAPEFNAERFAKDLNIWGGPGSVMDQALVNQPRQVRREFEDKAIHIAEAMQAMDISSPLVEHWVAIFRQWNESGV